ncbi:MAG: hypothetical protein GF368_02010 [Candidatus Aenigmarchaeota archaeon]|nr:hypothetical protein [Candidatus Aenigmarchaeota archaeon]
MKLSKEIRLISLGVLLLLSLVFLIYPLTVKKTGVVVVSVSEDSACEEILTPGSSITSINGNEIEDSEDFYTTIDGLSDRINLIVNGGPRVCTIEGNKINAKVRDFEGKGLKFGIDVKDGKKIVLEADETKNSMEVINSRVKSYDLTNLDIQKVSDKRIGIIFGPENEEEIEEILQPGIVSAKFLKIIETENKTGELLVNNVPYEFNVNNNSIAIENQYYRINDEFILEGINIELQNVSQNYTNFYLHVFNDRDVEKDTVGQNKRVFQNQGSYVFVAEIGLSQTAGEKFAKVTEGQPITINPEGENYLRDPLVLMVDGEIITSVPVSSSEAGKEVERINLWGVENTREEANKKLQIITTFLKSGRLSDITILERGTSEPDKADLINTIPYILLGTICVSGVYSFFRKKNIKLAGLTLTVLATEILLYLGAASSPLFALFVLVTSVTFLFVNKDLKSWFKWISIILIIVIGFGAVVNKLIIDSYALFGVTFGLLVSLGHFIFLNEKMGKTRKKREKSFKLIWKITLLLLTGLTVVFFLQDYKNFSIASVIILMTSLALTHTEYTRLSKKLKSR